MPTAKKKKPSSENSYDGAKRLGEVVSSGIRLVLPIEDAETHDIDERLHEGRPVDDL